MRRVLPWLGAWIPVGLWSGLIYLGSTGAFTSSRTSRFIRPFVLWLHPGANDGLVALVQTVARKGWHMTEYAILLLWVWRALGRGPGVPPSAAHRAVLAWLWCATYALGDEFHQSFVDGREGTLRDMGFDILGAFLALAAIAVRRRWRRDPA